MLNLMKLYQEDMMILLAGVCGIMALFVPLTETMSKPRRKALMLLEISAMILMIADRHAYMSRGDITVRGWWLVRISNFLVFFLTLLVIYAFNMYLIDLFTHEGRLSAIPKRLKAVRLLALAGMALVVISQFTGLYYTFDEMNRYQRAPAYLLCYAIPFTILLLQMSVTIQYYRRLSKSIGLSLLLFVVLSIVTSVLQIFMYGLSLNNISIATGSALLYIFALQDLNREVARRRKQEIERYKEEREREHNLFEQTAEALASAIDAKDPYTHGHSARVAMYSTRIAREAGLSDEECEQVYFAALLHDVGKIGVPDAVINKPGRLTEEEFALIKQHPVKGNQILSRVQQSPYLSIGAHYHHERYDGRGYPDGLKGNDIPQIARIIGVADAYDAMTSKRSYRDPIPQQTVREEIMKGAGTQFDPEYAKIMLHLIDLDMEYTMRERETGEDDAIASQLKCEEIFHECTIGIPVTQKKTMIQLCSKPEQGLPEKDCLPTLVLFDALDARIHEEEAKKKDLLYLEYARIRFDGNVTCEAARKAKVREKPTDPAAGGSAGKQYINYSVEAVRVKDHVLIRVSGASRAFECIIALPNNSLFSYLSLTGEHCLINNIRVDREDKDTDEKAIPRIAEEISYIRGCPEGDIPNVQIDGWRSRTTKGIPVADSLKLTFHTRSLPTARLIWHCPYITLFTSVDGTADGPGFREFILLRLDGENWDSDKHAQNEVHIDHTRDFPGWNVWKETNKNGMDCTVTIQRNGNRVTMETCNLGIAIDTATTIMDNVSELYVALTGDQCALTDIRIE